mgnify:CR=1 FL=1
MKKKFESLETFRAFAALMIAAVHFRLDSPLVNHFLASGIFVPFFFTLSGFVIYFNYHDKIIETKDFTNFVKKRFLRLYPLHLFFLLVFLLMEVSRLILTTKYNVVSNIDPFSTNDLMAFISNIFLFQTFLSENTFNTPSWSISAEFYTYILFAIIIIYRLNNFVLIILASILIYRLYNFELGFGPSTTYNSFLDCIYCFLIGVLFCKIYFKINNKLQSQGVISLLSLIFIFISIISIKFILGKLQFFIPIIFGFLILTSANLDQSTFFGKVICNKFFVYLGKISYSIYLSHLFVFWIITQVLRFIFKFETYIDSETGFLKLNLSGFESNLLVLISYVTTIVFSHLTYKFIEIKFYKK